MIWFISLSNVPCLFFETKLNSLLVWIEMSDFVTFFVFSFLMTDSSNFNSIFINFQLNCLLSVFLIIFTWKVIFFLCLRDKVDSYNGLGFLLLFLFFFINWFMVLFLDLFNDIFTIFFIDSLFRKISFCELI